jgi:arginine/serine-rich splicing factor 1/9
LTPSSCVFEINQIISSRPSLIFLSLFLYRDASDAVRGRDNYDFYGYRLRVEFAKGRRNDRDRDDRRDDRRDGDRYGRDDRRDDRRGGDRDRRERKERPRREFRPRNTAFRVLVKGLPDGASWQDLKDFIKKAVRPIYTDVEKDSDGNPMGIVGFENADDVDRCISKLDDTKFTSKGSDKDCYVRVTEDKDHKRGGGDAEGGGRKSRSRSRSPAGNRRGRSPSPRRDASRSRSRSPVAARDGKSRSPSRTASQEQPMENDQGGSPAAREASPSPAPRSRSPTQGVDAPV